MNMLPASARRSLEQVRAPSAEHQQAVQFHLETMEAVLKGALVARVGEQVCTDWWRLRRGAGILIEDARQAGLREMVALSDWLCEMADHVLLGLVSVGLAAEPVTVVGEGVVLADWHVRDSMRSLFFWSRGMLRDHRWGRGGVCMSRQVRLGAPDRLPLAQMAPDEVRRWIHETRAALQQKMAREQTYLEWRAACGVRTPTDEAYEADQVLEADLLAFLDEMEQGLEGW